MAKQDLTQGNITKTLIKYAVPMITTSLFQSVYSIADVIIAGHFIGGDGISAINNSGLIINLVTQIAIGITVGGNVLIGQYFGAKKYREQKYSSGTLFVLSVMLGILSFLLLYIPAEHFLKFLGAPSLEKSAEYLRICAVGMPFIFGYNAISAILRALGNSSKPMLFIIASSCCNVVLDIVFVIFMGMGVAGAAAGTVISQFVSFAAALIYITRSSKEYGFERKYIKFIPQKAGRILKLGFPIALQWTVASISWLAVAFLINKYGVDVSAGNGVSNKIKDFCQLFISAVTSAGATMAAQNLGAGQFERGREVMKLCMKVTVAAAAFLILISEAATPFLVSVFTSEEPVAHAAVVNLRIEIIAQLFYAGFMTYNVLATASGDTMFVMANSFLNCIVVRLVLAFILEHFIGLNGVYLACMIAPLSSVPVGYLYYKSGKWRKSIAAAEGQ